MPENIQQDIAEIIKAIRNGIGEANRELESTGSRAEFPSEIYLDMAGPVNSRIRFTVSFPKRDLGKLLEA